MLLASSQRLKQSNQQSEDREFESELKSGAAGDSKTAAPAAGAADAKSSAHGARVQQLLPHGRGVLALALDAAHGASVSDHAIFQAHARKYEKEFLEDMQVCSGCVCVCGVRRLRACWAQG